LFNERGVLPRRLSLSGETLQRLHNGGERVTGGVVDATTLPHLRSFFHEYGPLQHLVIAVSGAECFCKRKVAHTPNTPRGHQEINPFPDTPSQWVTVRNSQEPIVINLEPLDATQRKGNTSTHNFS